MRLNIRRSFTGGADKFFELVQTLAERCRYRQNLQAALATLEFFEVFLRYWLIHFVGGYQPGFFQQGRVIAKPNSSSNCR